MTISRYTAAVRRLAALPQSLLSLAIVATLPQQGYTAIIEEVVVTAQKKAASLQDTPIAISAYTSESLEQMGANGAADIGEYTPNVTITPSIGSNYNIRMSVRGLGTAEPSLAVDPKVGIYLDGAYIARNSGAIFDIVDLERIEILRGPQGTLWGKNTTGGAINIVTRKPTGEFGGKISASAGSDGYQKLGLSVDTPSVNNISAKISAVMSETDGWATNSNPASEKNLGSEETKAYRIALRWDVLDSLSVDYFYDKTDGESVPVPLQLGNVGAPDTAIGTYFIDSGSFISGANVFSDMQGIANDQDRLESFELDFAGREYVDIQGHNLTLSWALDNVEIKSITAYREYESDFSEGNDLDGGTYTAEQAGNTIAIPGFHTVNIREQDQISQEFQFIGSALDNWLNYVVGVYHFEEDGRELNPWTITFYDAGSNVNVLFDGSYGSFYEMNSESDAIYGQFDVDATDRLTLTLGMRYTEDEKTLTLLEEDPDLTTDQKASENWSQFTGAVTASYQLSDDINLYGKVAEGYSAGVYNPGTIDRAVSFPDNIQSALVPADPEEITSYEIGMKSQLLEGRLQLNAAAFYNDNRNLQITDIEQGTGRRFTTNSGEFESTGVEFDIIAVPIDELTINFSYGYIGDNRSNPVSARNTASLGIQYDYPIALGLVTARFDTTYSDAVYFSNSDPSVKSDERTLMNARLSLSEVAIADGNLRVSLWGRNLADEEYIVHGANLGFFTGYSWGAPRSSGIDVAYEF